MGTGNAPAESAHMQLPRVIAICGAKRAGKDAVAQYLHDVHGYEVRKFAAPLKAAVQVLFGFDDAQMESDAKDVVDARYRVTPRAIMQYIGTDVMQLGLQRCVPGVGRTFWAERLFREYQRERIVISDLRFPHELAVIARETRGDFAVLKVVRPPSSPGGGRGAWRDEHASETAHLDIPADAVVINAGSLRDLHAGVDEAMQLDLGLRR